MTEHTIKGILRETEKAWLVELNGVGHWIPKSASTIKDDKILIADWFAAKMEYSGALFSDDNTRRYVLWRVWNKSRKVVLCIGLNPSTANKNKNDQTIDRLVTTLDRKGYGGLQMVNLFSIISSSPDILLTPEAKATEEMDLGIIFGYAIACEEIIFCWGTFDEAKERAQKVIDFFTDGLCFGKNKDGSPWHPLALMYAGFKPGDNKARLFKFREHTYEANVYDRKERKKKAEYNAKQYSLIKPII